MIHIDPLLTNNRWPELGVNAKGGDGDALVCAFNVRVVLIEGFRPGFIVLPASCTRLPDGPLGEERLN
jgi:hypothetical protein